MLRTWVTINCLRTTTTITYEPPKMRMENTETSVTASHAGFDLTSFRNVTQDVVIVGCAGTEVA